ncbi:MAG: KH domain-containing protein [Candidatus Dormibacteria bacterium]
MADYRELVEFIVRSIVDNPDSVEVETRARHRAETVEIRLHPGDVGRVIGKSGRNIEAIRSVVKAAAIKDHKRVNVEVLSESDEFAAGAREPEAGDEVAPLGDVDRVAEPVAVVEVVPSAPEPTE